MMSAKQISKLMPNDCFGGLCKEIDRLGQEAGKSTEKVLGEELRVLFRNEMGQFVKQSVE
jgi:hypothetical protein